MSRHLQDCAVLYGDSITQRSSAGSFSQRMSEFYVRRLDIHNRGYGGWNSEWARVIFDRIFAKKEEAAGCPAVRLVTIWFGANDACLPDRRVQALPVPRFIDNLNFFLESLTSPSAGYALSTNPSALNIVLITPPPIYPGMMSEDRARDRSWEHSMEYREAVLKLGEEWKGKEKEGGGWKVGVVDAWKAVVKGAGGEGEELEPFFDDGLHLNSEGYAFVFDAFKHLIQNDFKGRGLDPEIPEDLPFRVPWFNSFVQAPDIPEAILDGFKLPACRQE